MRIKIGFLLLYILLISTVAGHAATTTADVAVGKIQLGISSLADVTEDLGPAKRQLNDTGQLLVCLVYPGLRIGFVNENEPVALLQIDTNQYQTARGIKVGGTAYKILKEYGEPKRQIIKGHRYFIYELDDVPGQRLIFDMSDGHVSRIIMTSLAEYP